jgi:hypothetical protein
MSKIRHEYYPTLTDGERKLLYCKIQQRHKSHCVLRRLLHKETMLHGRIIIRKNILRYRRSLDPRGEPFASRRAPWKCVIKTNDIAYLLGICYKYAQQKHKLLKDELGKKYVTVKEFCVSVKMDEEYVQLLLNDGDAREYNGSKWQKKIDEINRRHEEEIRRIKEVAKKEKEEDAKRKQVFNEKKETPAANDDKNKKVTKPKKRHKSFDGLDE